MNHLPDSNHIVYFFLDLYRRQIGLPEPDPRLMSARALTLSNNSGEITYELKIIRGGRENTRRMSLCRLGDDATSRSTCYKVIYDDLLVLKVPPEPVTDFDGYLEKIELEHLTADRLNPEIPCVSPSVTAILNKDPEFRNEGGTSQCSQETDVIDRLKGSPSLQGYLKIRGTFVFFMNVSKHLFFDRIIDKMHRQETLSRQNDCREPSYHGRHYGLSDRLRRGERHAVFSVLPISGKTICVPWTSCCCGMAWTATKYPITVKNSGCLINWRKRPSATTETSCPTDSSSTNRIVRNGYSEKTGRLLRRLLNG